MELLKKENWWVWLLLALLSGGSSTLILGALLNIYDSEAWYAKWFHKLPKALGIGILFVMALVTILPTIVVSFSFIVEIPEAKSMNTLLGVLGLLYLIVSGIFLIFQIQILAQVNAKLKSPGGEIYLSPYIWILGLIIPIIGWILLIVMYLYLQIWYLVMLYRGSLETV